MKRGKREDRLRPPLMLAFRQAFKTRNDRKADAAAGEAVIVQSRRTVSVAVSEVELRDNLTADLEALLNTTNLESTLDLGPNDYVRRSIVNFGIYDLVHRTAEETSSFMIEQELRDAIARYEPRILADSLHIVRDASATDDDLKIRFIVRGDMDCDPAPAPVEFVAHLEVASGKLAVSKR